MIAKEIARKSLFGGLYMSLVMSDAMFDRFPLGEVAYTQRSRKGHWFGVTQYDWSSSHGPVHICYFTSIRSAGVRQEY
jgi:hypothetical protein